MEWLRGKLGGTVTTQEIIWTILSLSPKDGITMSTLYAHCFNNGRGCNDCMGVGVRGMVILDDRLRYSLVPVET